MRFAMMAAMALTANAADVVIDLGALQAGQEPLTVGLGKQVTITAVENRSTGYSWDVTNNCGAKFTLADDQYGYEDHYEGEQISGQQGRRTFSFETPTEVADGEPCEMTFKYKRPWLAEVDSDDDIKKLTFVVGETA